LALLLFRTLIPPAVLILALKPWVRARFILLGWNVLFIFYTPSIEILQLFEKQPFKRNMKNLSR
jgi:hypothetical protein